MSSAYCGAGGGVMKTLSLIVAMAENRCIGIENRLPWHLPEDLKFFKRTTLGKPIIMGRKTFDSIGRPLPERTNIVITRNSDWQHDGVVVVNTLESAIKAAENACQYGGVEEAVVIGGEQIYCLALPYVDRLYITRVKAIIDGDAFFPEFDQSAWHIADKSEHLSDERNPHGYTIECWVKN